MDATTAAQFGHLDDLIGPIRPDSIVSRTLFKTPAVKAVLFGFAAGQSLSEHSAGQRAILNIVRGSAQITVDGETRDAQPGTWIDMPPRMRHSVVATTDLIMLLLLIEPCAPTA